MTLLPIVDRELRVSARKPATFWLRIVAALIGLFIAIGCIVLNEVSGGGTATFGNVLFRILSWLSLGAALSAGLFLTSDCLSEEKREGTLGLLFLTDLRGYDVVAGKLLVTSLRASYALLAIFPILAITLLMGGVAPAYFWKASLALLNALFCSLTAGLFVSALSRDAHRALGGLVSLLVLVTFGGLLADSALAQLNHRGFIPFWSLAGPSYPFVSAGFWGRNPYWTSLLITHGIGWCFFGAACLLITRTWQDRDDKTAATAASGPLDFSQEHSTHRKRSRSKLLDLDVVLWLMCRERRQAAGLWSITLLAIGAFVWLVVGVDRQAWMFWQYLSWFFLLFFYLWAASQACRFLVQARRSGLLELLLITPITDRQIIRGQWRAIFRKFGLPMLLVALLVGAGAWLSQSAWQRIMAAVPATPPVTVGATNSSSSVATGSVVLTFGGTIVSSNSNVGAVPSPGKQSWYPIYQVVSLGTVGLAATTVAANFLALFWFGMWMGMTSKTANTATAKTILFVHVIPWLCISFITGILVSLFMMSFAIKAGVAQSTNFVIWYPLMSVVCTGLLTFAKDVGFIVFARNRLYGRLRTQACGDLARPVQPVAPLPIAPPPVISPVRP